MKRPRIALLGAIALIGPMVFSFVGFAERAYANAKPATDYSLYINRNNSGWMYQLGQNQANYDKSVGHFSQVILDFGGYYDDSGDQSSWEAGNLSQSTIEYLANTFIAGWASVQNRQIMILWVGGNNFFGLDYNKGVASAHTEEEVRSYSNYYNDGWVGGAMDFEDWNNSNANQGYAWFNGFNAASGNAYINFGSINGCPPAGNCDPPRWNLGDYYNLSQGWSQSHSAPEIYFPINAQQWNYLAQNTNGPNGRVWPQGPMTEVQRYKGCCPPPPPGELDPTGAWNYMTPYFPSMSSSFEIHWMSDECHC